MNRLLITALTLGVSVIPAQEITHATDIVALNSTSASTPTTGDLLYAETIQAAR